MTRPSEWRSSESTTERRRAHRGWWVLVSALVLLISACTDDRPKSAIGVVPANEQPATGIETAVRPFEEPAPLTWRALGEPGIASRVAAVRIDPSRPNRILVGTNVGGVGYSGDGGRSWQRSIGLTSHEIGRFSFDTERPGVVWVGTMGGPFRSDDGGETWELRRAGMPEISPDFYTAPIEIVLSDPSRRGNLLAFGGSHTEHSSLGEPEWGVVWESFDNGLTWARRSTVVTGGNIVAATRTTDGAVLVSVLGAGVFRSADSAKTWAPINEGLPHTNVRDIVVHPSDPAVAWVALGAGDVVSSPVAGGIYRTGDGGATWKPTQAGLQAFLDPGGLFSSSYETIAVAPSDPQTLYTADTAAGKEIIYKTTDAGTTWRKVLDGPGAVDLQLAYNSGPTATAIAVDATDADRVVVGQHEYLLRTLDGGDSWDVISSSAPAAGTFIGRGYSSTVATDISFGLDGAVSLLALDGANLSRSDDGLRSWSRPLVTWDPWGGAYEMSQSDVDESTSWILLGQAGIFNGIGHSEDGGQTWDVTVGGGLPDRGAVTGDGNAILALPDGRALALIGGELYRSEGPGSRWDLIQTGLALTDIEQGVSGPQSLVLGGEAGLFMSEDGGDNLTLVEGSRVRPTSVVVDHKTNDIYVLGWREPTGGLWRYRDGTWTRLFDETHAYDLAIDPTASQHLLLATNDRPFHDSSETTGVWRSTDGGASWTQMNQGLTMLRVSRIAFDPANPGRVLAGTHGGGFFHTTGVLPNE